MGGLRGAIMFLQKEQNQRLEIKVQMDPFSGEFGLGIYSYPMVYNGNAQDSCSSGQIGALIPNGNLTEKHGPFTYKMAVTNTQLKAYGRDSVLGMQCKQLAFLLYHSLLSKCIKFLFLVPKSTFL